ncbi:hypothetical protein Ocin01_16658 [Orchesella cincta]|uniref:Uncharacterized protein n=1 Tax=Orchesella cincta TaxID=48709 RepID=A0A1D2MAK8_ORCCI|nr:hypothetical protein Ocin01_16658 [Orchesella cincta]
MDPEVDGRLEAINYFAPSYMDVWPESLDYLTEESDINAVLCASPMFGTAWGSRRASVVSIVS